MNYILFLISFLIFFSCSDTESYKTTYQTDYRDKSYFETLHIGETCNTGCIWSSYAVSQNVQQEQKVCVEGPCACVENGNIYNLCEEKSSIRETVEEESYFNVEMKDIPYYNQYNNANYGWATCQNTSVAMVLSYYENQNIHPDTIFNDWGKDLAQSPSGLNAVYSYYAKKSSILTYTNASPEDLRVALQRGYTAIVHGYFTSSGHVVVVKKFDGQNYYVNDPAGVWDQCFKCGYSGSYDGITSYNKSAFEKAVFTSNGTSYLPGWIHIISPL